MQLSLTYYYSVENKNNEAHCQVVLVTGASIERLKVYTTRTSSQIMLKGCTP